MRRSTRKVCLLLRQAAGTFDAARVDSVKAKLSEFGYIVTGRTGAEMAETIRTDRLRFEPLVKRLGIKMN